MNLSSITYEPENYHKRIGLLAFQITDFLFDADHALQEFTDFQFGLEADALTQLAPQATIPL